MSGVFKPLQYFYVFYSIATKKSKIYKSSLNRRSNFLSTKRHKVLRKHMSIDLVRCVKFVLFTYTASFYAKKTTICDH